MTKNRFRDRHVVSISNRDKMDFIDVCKNSNCIEMANGYGPVTYLYDD